MTAGSPPNVMHRIDAWLAKIRRGATLTRDEADGLLSVLDLELIKARTDYFRRAILQAAQEIEAAVRE